MNYLQRCIRPGVEDEPCIIPFYTTTNSQRDILLRYLSSSSSFTECLPLHWKIEVADQHNGWFEGVALHYRVSDHSFHVIIKNSNSANSSNGDDKDKLEEAYNDYLAYDHRVIRLIECCDYYSKPLFNQFVRDSVMAVQWDIDWLEDCPSLSLPSTLGSSLSASAFNVHQHDSSSYSSRFGSVVNARSEHHTNVRRQQKKWNSRATYYLRALNVVLVEAHELVVLALSSTSCPPPSNLTNEIPRNYIMLYLDQYVCLHQCLDSASWNEFHRLVMDEPDILSSLRARQQVKDVKKWSYAFSASVSVKSTSSSSAPSQQSHTASLSPSKQSFPISSRTISGPNKKEEAVIPTCHTCVICLENEICNIAFIPCGHQAVCEHCSLTILPRKPKSSSYRSLPWNVQASNLCPICRSSVQSCLRVYKV
jgi:hypothetical protein